MRKGLLGVTFIFLCWVACDDNSDDDAKKSTSAKATATEVQNTAVNGQWRITYFLDTNNDETNNFSGYIFEFDPNNVMTATNGSNNYPGIWAANNDDTKDNRTKRKDRERVDFSIAFTNPAAFEELTEDWEIISISASKIELRGGKDRTDLLTFEKI